MVLSACWALGYGNHQMTGFLCLPNFQEKYQTICDNEHVVFGVNELRLLRENSLKNFAFVHFHI